MDNVNPVATPQAEVTPPETPEVQPVNKVSPTVPYERFREVNQKYRQSEAKLKELEQKVTAPADANSNDVEVLKVLAKQAGLMSREDLLREQFDAIGEEFADKNNEFYAPTPEGDANWKILQEELARQVRINGIPASAKSMDKLLERTHNDLFKKPATLEEAKEEGKREALAQQLTNQRATLGSGTAVRTSAPGKFSPEIEAKLSSNPVLRKKQIEIMESLD